MNFKPVNVSGKSVLVNFDNVCEIHSALKGGCNIYFNTMADSEEQAYIKIDETIEDMEKALL